MTQVAHENRNHRHLYPEHYEGMTRRAYIYRESEPKLVASRNPVMIYIRGPHWESLRNEIVKATEKKGKARK